MKLNRRQLAGIGIAVGAVYGLFVRFMFGLGDAGSTFVVMSSSFILGAPFALGFLSVWFGETPTKHPFMVRLFLSWTASLAFMLGCLLLFWEGIICVIIWLPLTLVLSSLGGAVAGLIRYLIRKSAARNSCVVLVAGLPFLLAPLEKFKATASEIRTVQTQIEINGPAAAVWQQIKSVPAIQENEQSLDFSHVIGFPRPVEAVLSGSGLGAVRYARFEGNVLFVETITEWRENERLSFHIQADTAHIPPTTFDEHVTVGGRYFDVLQGTYWIEPLATNRVILHLASNQRLSTHFNFYAHWWTEALMADLQNYILKIIKHRVEHPSPTAGVATAILIKSPRA